MSEFRHILEPNQALVYTVDDGCGTVLMKFTINRKNAAWVADFDGVLLVMPDGTSDGDKVYYDGQQIVAKAVYVAKQQGWVFNLTQTNNLPVLLKSGALPATAKAFAFKEQAVAAANRAICDALYGKPAETVQADTPIVVDNTKLPRGGFF